MKTVRFEPGDGTRYNVLLHLLSLRERFAYGGLGDGPAYLFGMNGSDQHVRVFPFQQGAGYLDLSYYTEKMSPRGDVPLYTLAAGLIVLGYLTGRSVGGFSDRLKEQIDREWNDDWRDQLAPLLDRSWQ